MTHEAKHLDERLDDWLDSRLDERERRAVEAHLAGCARCRNLRDSLLAGRDALRLHAAAPAPARPDLGTKLAAWLDQEDLSSRFESRAPSTRAAARPGAPRLWMAAAALILVALGAAFIFRRAVDEPIDPVGEAFAEHDRLRGAALPVTLAATSAATVEERWARAPIAFPSRVLDLSRMGIELAGGDATTLGGAVAARSVYRGPDGWILCWMLEETAVGRWRASAERQRVGNFDFEIHRRPGATLVVWREGSVICALLGGGDPEIVIALAQAKAMAPPPAAASTS